MTPLVASAYESSLSGNRFGEQDSVKVDGMTVIGKPYEAIIEIAKQKKGLDSYGKPWEANS
ncbi:MAG TPA: hypothetical protein DCP92_12440 [Nitrospiraceae bacterium]|jgi:hypothetical protein|nr:hypothetical protein [Nitrospiraceae bacterium]